ncbi:MAG: hypothetical protein AAFU85_02735 [Planctomycetota bacterium]
MDRDAEDGVTISQRAEDATRVSNPPAQHIRFNGNEHLLGGGSCQALPPHELLATIKALRKSSKHRSARLFIQLHKRSAQRLLLEKPSGAADPDVLLVAATLDQFSATSLWTELLHQCASQPELAERWQSRVHEFRTNASGLTEATARQLKLLADQLASPLLQIEALRLEGQLQIASEETPSAIESLVSGAELATTMDTSGIASDLWLMACEASLRVDAVEQARKCWAAAVSSHLDSLQVREDDLTLPSIDTVFWEQAARLIHPGDSFPDELVSTMEPWCARIGIQTFHALTPETSLWSAISEYQIATGQPHLASLSLKRADAHATEQTRPLLQIALARAMAAQGEQAVAATILGKESASKDPNVRASALAVLGAIKIQSGAYEQGTRFVSEALSIDEATQWPGQLSARADLANVQMIVGDIDDALPALHAVQAEMLGQRKWQSLCQSLENEAAILEVEGRNKEAKAIRRRIHEINQLPQ